MAEQNTAEMPNAAPDWLTSFGKDLANAGLKYAQTALGPSSDKTNLGADQQAAEIKADLKPTNLYIMAGVGIGAAVLVFLIMRK